MFWGPLGRGAAGRRGEAPIPGREEISGGGGGLEEKVQVRTLGAKTPPVCQELPAQAHLGGGCLTICWGHPSGNP